MLRTSQVVPSERSPLEEKKGREKISDQGGIRTHGVWILNIIAPPAEPQGEQIVL